MSDWPIGLSTGCFYQISIFDVLDTIRDGGFNMLEICSFPRHLDYHNPEMVGLAARRIQEAGLQPISFHAPFADKIDITALDSQKREHALQEILQAAEAAAILKVPYFVIHPGPEREGKPPEEEHFRRMRYAAQALNQVAQRCRELQMNLILENMLPHLLFGQTSDILWIMGAIQAMNLGACLDTGHANLSGDLYTVMYKLSGHLRLVHAADNRGQYDDHLPPGQGKINWKRVLAKLLESGFQGPLILELAGDEKKPPEQILTGARAGRQLLRDISQQLSVDKSLLLQQ